MKRISGMNGFVFFIFFLFSSLVTVSQIACFDTEEADKTEIVQDGGNTAGIGTENDPVRPDPADSGGMEPEDNTSSPDDITVETPAEDEPGEENNDPADDVSTGDDTGSGTGEDEPSSGDIGGDLPSVNPQSPVMDHRNTDITVIPDEYITAAKNRLHIAYQHTSHGSQIISGMNVLRDYEYFGNKYQWTDDGSAGLDLDDYGIMAGYHDLSTEDSEDENGDTPWANATRTLLDAEENYHINVVMWSWCSIRGHNIGRYLTNMERLISEYGDGGTNERASAHPVEFVFMTGHTEGLGDEGTIAMAAAQIRQHCEENARWLIDYYSIECYDPDGNYFGDKNANDDLSYNSGNWAAEYLERHEGGLNYMLTLGDGDTFSGCTSCAHSDAGEGERESTLNCVLKGQAAWHLFARLAGWSGEPE